MRQLPFRTRKGSGALLQILLLLACLIGGTAPSRAVQPVERPKPSVRAG